MILVCCASRQKLNLYCMLNDQFVTHKQITVKLYQNSCFSKTRLGRQDIGIDVVYAMQSNFVDLIFMTYISK